MGREVELLIDAVVLLDRAAAMSELGRHDCTYREQRQHDAQHRGDKQEHEAGATARVEDCREHGYFLSADS